MLKKSQVINIQGGKLNYSQIKYKKIQYNHEVTWTMNKSQ